MAATLDDVRSYVVKLPGTEETTSYGNEAWAVRGKTYAWHRPLSKADIKRYGDVEPPSGELIGVKTMDLGDKEAILAAGTPGFFTIEHLNGYPAFLIQLDVVKKKDLKAALMDAWLVHAPADLAAPYLE